MFHLMKNRATWTTQCGLDATAPPKHKNKPTEIGPVAVVTCMPCLVRRGIELEQTISHANTELAYIVRRREELKVRTKK